MTDTPNTLYIIVSEDDVYRRLVSIALSLFNPIGGTINIKNLSSLMNTSTYQIRKHMRSLKSKEMVELKCVFLPDDEEIYPPYWGYKLTEKGRNTPYFKAKEHEEIELIQRSFGLEATP